MNDSRSPIEQELHKRFEDPDSVAGKPLPRRVRQTKRTLESYLKAGVMPRYMQRLRDIDHGIARERARLAEDYRALREECGHDAELFAQRWRAQAGAYSNEQLNELIREHNEWYPVEASLPMDPRTRDYVRRRGRSYRRPELGPAWVLEQFPA